MDVVKPFGFLALILVAVALQERAGWGWFSAICIIVCSIIIGIVDTFAERQPPDWPLGPGTV